MATIDEYRAVHDGMEPPTGRAATREFGDGGCNIIFRDKGGVIGRWSSWETASLALDRLQELGGGFEYRLEEFHHWVEAPEHETTCSLCGAVRRAAVPAGATAGLDWLGAT